MRTSLFFFLMLIACHYSAQAQDCPTDIPSSVPSMEEGLGDCETCGACAGADFGLPEVADVGVFESAAASGDDMVFGQISATEIEGELSNEITPFTAEQVIGIGEFVDANFDMAEYLDCINLNCYSVMGATSAGSISMGSEILEGLGNLDGFTAEEIAEFNGIMASHNNSTENYYALIQDYDFSAIDPDNINSEIYSDLELQFPGCTSQDGSMDLNCIIERFFGQSSIPEGNDSCNIFDPSLQAPTNPSSGQLKMNFDVEGDVDMFSTKIPGTATEGQDNLLPGPSGMNILKNATDNVSLYNGTVNAQVPIHALVANDISIPISLSMNGNGVKVDAIGSEIGTNWTLSAGGAITRVVKNLPDEYRYTGNGNGRTVGRGRGPSTVLKPCVTVDLGGANLVCPPKRVEWDVMRPNAVRFNIQYATVLIPIAPFVVIPINLYLTIEVQLNVRMKPDYYTMVEKGLGYMHLQTPEELKYVLSESVATSIDISKFSEYSTEKRGKILAAANGKRNFEDLTFISSRLGTLFQFFQGVSNLFGEEKKVYTNIDLQADEFHYNFPGYSGTFVIDQSGRVHSRPANDLEIKPGKIVEAFGSTHLSGFTVETPEGMIYTFGVPNGELEARSTGVEFTKHKTYNLPNYLTYPRNVDGTYRGALIDQSAFPYSANVLCYPRALTYGSTYENLYTTQESPIFSSAWKLTEVHSLLTQEDVYFTYEGGKDKLRYNSSKVIKHKFPNFGINANQSSFTGNDNSDLNPFGNTEYTNLKGEFTYSLVETEYNEQRLVRIESRRLEDVTFEYSQTRKDIHNGHLLNEIKVYRDNGFYRSYRLNYDDFETNNVFGCTSTPIEGGEVPNTSTGFFLKFKRPFEKWHFDMQNLRFLTWTIGFECDVEAEGPAPNPEVGLDFLLNWAAITGSQTHPVFNLFKKNIRIPIPLPTIPQDVNNLDYLDEYGSILYVKALEKDGENSLTPGEVETEEAVFNTESGRSFLSGVDVIGNDGDVLPHVNFEYHGDLSLLPKRFSTQKDKWGYFNQNRSKSFLQPLKYKGFDGNEVSVENDSVVKSHYDFIDSETDPSLSQFGEGQAQISNLQYAQIGALKKIIYPTGGITEFEYELNDVLKEVDSGPDVVLPSSGAGLRLKKRTQHADATLKKTTNYQYGDPTIVNHPDFIVESPLARSNYDKTGLQDILNDIICNDEALEMNIANIFSSISLDENSFNTNDCGYEGTEILVSASSQAQNNWMMNGGGYVGYNTVTEVLGEEEDNIGKVVHDFITPEETGVNIDSLTHLNHRIKNIINGGFWTHGNGVALDIPPFGQVLTHPQRFGLEESSMSYNTDNQLVQSVANSYKFRLGSCRGIPSPNDMYDCSPAISINSLSYDRRHPGNFLVNLIYGRLTNMIPRKSAPVAFVFVRLLSEGVIGDHPFKVINRDYLYGTESFLVEAPRLESSIVTNYFPEDDSSNSSTTINKYRIYDESYGGGFLLQKSATTFSNGQSKSTEYYYLQDQTTDDLIDDPTATYLKNFGENIGYNKPLRIEETVNGTLVSGKMSSLYVVGSGNSRQIRPHSTWGVVSGKWQLTAYHKAWHESTMPTETYVGEYKDELSYDLSTYDFFGKRETVYDGFLLPQFLKSFDNNGGNPFERTFGYNTFKELVSVVDENGILTESEYDGFGRLKKQISNNGKITNDYTYNYSPPEISSVTTFTDGTPTQSVTESFNGLGMPTHSTRQDGALLSSSTYDNQFRVETSKSIGSPLTTNTYESSPLSRTLSTAQGENTTSFQYTAKPNPDYDAPDFYQRILVTDPNDHTSESVTDALGRTTFTKSAVGAETEYLLDNFGRPDNIINPIKEEYSFGYNGFGALQSKTIPNSSPERQWYDRKYRLIATKASSGAVTTIKYDEFNRPVETYYYPTGGPNPGSEIAEATPSLYLSENLFTTTAYQFGKTWPEKTTGRILDETNALEGVISTTVSRDDIGRPTSTTVTYPDGPFSQNITTPTFNDANQIVSTSEVLTGSFNITVNNRTEYDNVLRPTERHLRLGNEPEYFLSRYAYSGEDQVTTKFLGGSENNTFLQRITYDYDDLYRLIKINDPVDYSCLQPEVPSYCEFSAKYSIGFSSKCVSVTGIRIDGNLFNFSQPVSLLNQSSANNLISTINTILATNGLEGEFSQSVESDNVTLDYLFNVANLEANEFALVFGQQGCEFDLEFDRDNCCTPSNYFSENQTPWLGTSNSPNLYYQEMSYDGLNIEWIQYSGDCYLGQTRYDFGYDPDHRIDTAEHTIYKSDGTIIEGAYNAYYSYDLAGNLLTLDRFGRYDQTALPETALYGQIDQLTYSYQTNSSTGLPISKLESVTDQVTGIAQEFGFKPEVSSYGFDAAGNMLSGGGNTMVYNGFNFPQFIERGGTVHKIAYTSNGSPFRRTTTSPDTDPSTQTRYFVSGFEVIDDKVEFYNHGEGRIVFDKETNEQHAQYRITDHLGNTVVLFEDKDENGIIEENPDDGASSEVLQRELYYPFGMQLRGTSPLNANPDQNYLYNGKEQLKGTELYAYGFRYYDPAIGRFTGVDPLADKFASHSPYNYVLGNPIRLTDPDGRAPQDIIIIGSAEYQQQVTNALFQLAASSDAGFALVQNAISSDRDLVIADTRSDIPNAVSNFSDDYSTLSFDISQATTDLDAANGAGGSSLSQSLESSLSHELGHFENGLGQGGGSVLVDGNGYSTGIPADEPHAVEMENRVRADLGQAQRTHYGGLQVAGQEAVQSGSSPLGYALRPHGRSHQPSGGSNAAYQYLFHNVAGKSEGRRSYLLGGVSIDKLLKPGASTSQTRLYDQEK